MEIKTKHEINERRWVLHQNVVQSVSIVQINIVCKEVNIFIPSIRCEIYYKCKCDITFAFESSYFTLSEEDLEKRTFATKEELVKHL